MQVGFIGLGHLGMAMAKRLMAEGVDLIAWNRTRAKAVALGVDIAETPASLAAVSDVIFINVFDSMAVRDVLAGEGGLLSADVKGKIVIDTSTNHFSDVLDFHVMLKERGAFYVEAPVLGSIVPASQGALTVLVSCGKQAFDAALPYLEKIGKNIYFLETPSHATRMKLVNNLVLSALMATLAEAVVLGEKVGIDRSMVLNILASGAGNSGVMNAKRDKMLKDDFSTHFSVGLIYKDLHYLQDMAREMKSPVFTASVIKELYGLAAMRGMEGLDFSAVYKAIKELS